MQTSSLLLSASPSLPKQTCRPPSGWGEDIDIQTATRNLGNQEKRMLSSIACLLQDNRDDMISGELYRAMEKQVPMCYSLFGRHLIKKNVGHCLIFRWEEMRRVRNELSQFKSAEKIIAP
jgi:hypothetical protein